MTQTKLRPEQANLEKDWDFEGGELGLPRDTSFPVSPNQGDIFYRSDEDKAYTYTGAAWVVASPVTLQTAYEGGNSIQMTAGEGDIRIYNDEGTPDEILFLDEDTGYVGIGVVDPDTRLEVFHAGNQLKLSFDATDNAIFAVDTNGNLTITPSGTSVIIPSKLAFTQADLNEYIDSLTDGYLDLGATTGIRLKNSTIIDGFTAATIGLTIKAAVSQTSNLQVWTDSDDNVVANVTAEGKIQSTRGIRGVANDWGDSLSGWSYGDFVAEHTYTSTGNYDATGNAAGENYFSDATNTPFTQDDEDNVNWIVITSGTFKGAKAEITEYISATGVILKGSSDVWDEDLTNVSYKIYKPPQFIVSSGYSTHLHVGTDGVAHIINTGGKYTGDLIFGVKGTFDTDNADLMHLNVVADGHSNVDALQLFYNTGDLQVGDANQVIQISIDETEATGGEIDGLLIETTNASSVEKHAIHVGVGFDTALTVSGAPAYDPDWGYVALADNSVTDRLTEFTTPGDDVVIFDHDDDYILIGNVAVFEVLEVILATVSSKGVVPIFEYSTGDGTWDTLMVDDGTQGFTTSGLIDWTAPGDWAVTSHADGVEGAITEGFYIRITRTYTPVIPTEPIESYFKIYLEQAGNTGMQIDGQGVVKLPYLSAAPAALENGMIWMESDGLHLYYGGAEKTVAGA